jgi:hypothetical protein
MMRAVACAGSAGTCSRWSNEKELPKGRRSQRSCVLWLRDL